MKRAAALALAAVPAAAVAACTLSSKIAVVDTACDHYFLANLRLTLCDEPPLPQARVDALRVRYRAVCKARLSLNGSAESTRTLDTCSARIDSLRCGETVDDHSCDVLVPGALDDGAVCAVDAQCASTYCDPSPAVPVVLDAGATGVGCGRCAASIPSGNRCGPLVAGQCISGTRCFGGVCTVQTVTDEGARCASDTGGQSAPCRSGLSCRFQLSTRDYRCLPRGAVGDECGSTTDCQRGLSCLTGESIARCAPPTPEGAPCGGAVAACEPGTVCAPATGDAGAPSDSSGVTQLVCRRVTRAAAGEACDGVATICVDGACAREATGSGLAGICPTVIPDGQPCAPNDALHVCDLWAECLDGVCKIPDPGVCR